MRKELRNKIMSRGTVDTKKYRYIMKECGNHEKQWAEIRRLPIEDLDTTAAVDGWETVEVIE